MLINNGTFNLTNGKLDIYGYSELTNNKTMTVNDTVVKVGNNCTLTNNDTLNLTAYSFLHIFPGGTLTNETAGKLNVQTTTSPDSVVMRSHIQNYGELQNNGTLTNNGVITNYVDGTETSATGKVTGSNTSLDGTVRTWLGVTTISALKDAQVASDSYGGVAILPALSPPALNDNLDILRDTVIGPETELVVPSGQTLTVKKPSTGQTRLYVAGNLNISGGTLVTEGEPLLGALNNNAPYSEITLIGGSLKAEGNYTITNGGSIYCIIGNIQNGINISGNDPGYLMRYASATSEAELRKIITYDMPFDIRIDGNFAITSDIDVFRPMIIPAGNTLTVNSGVTLRVTDLRFDGTLTNRGTLEVVLLQTDSYGMEIRSGAVLNNYNTMNISNHVTLSGTLENFSGGDVNVYAFSSLGDEYTKSRIVIESGLLNNLIGGTVNNYKEIGGKVTDTSKPKIINSGTFNNSPITGVGQPGGASGGKAILWMENGIIDNTGLFTNNGNMNLNKSDLIHSGGTFDNYNAGGLEIRGGSFSTYLAQFLSFKNMGYMKVIDEYYDNLNFDSQNNICVLDWQEITFHNQSNWIDYTAEVHTEAGFEAANSKQEEKVASHVLFDHGELRDNCMGFGVYNRMDFKADFVMDDKTLSGFSEYWVLSLPNDGHPIPFVMTVNNGKTLTVGQRSTLHIDGGKLSNAGTIEIAAATGADETYVHGGKLEIWAKGGFDNTNGTVNNNCEFLVRHDENDSGYFDREAIIPGLVTNKPYELVANVYSYTGFNRANESNYFSRIEVKRNSVITLEQDMTITDISLHFEPGCGLIVPHGVTLTLKASSGKHNWLDNAGDISIYGNAETSGNFRITNKNNLEIGAASGEENASLIIGADGVLYNRGSIKIYNTGTLDASEGKYFGNRPVIGTYIEPTNP